METKDQHIDQPLASLQEREVLTALKEALKGLRHGDANCWCDFTPRIDNTHSAKCLAAQRALAKAESAPSVPRHEERLRQYVATLRADAEDAKARGYVEACNAIESCATGLELLLAESALPVPRHEGSAMPPCATCGHKWGDHAMEPHMDYDIDNGKRPCFALTDGECRCRNYESAPSVGQQESEKDKEDARVDEPTHLETARATASVKEVTHASVTRTRLHRSEELLRRTLSMLCHFVWYRQLRPGEHLWSIPVDHERDFDCILSDAIDELIERRASSVAAAPAWRAMMHEATNLMHIRGVVDAAIRDWDIQNNSRIPNGYASSIAGAIWLMLQMALSKAEESPLPRSPRAGEDQQP